MHTPAPLDPDRVIATWRFASQVHQTQHMPASQLPYLTHLGMVSLEIVMAHLAEPFESNETFALALQCAMLHDSIEDQNVLHAQLTEQYGEAVADGVLALSKDAQLPKAEAMQDSLRRIRQQPKAIWCVKLADRISNLQGAPAHWNCAKKQQYKQEAQLILESLGNAHAYLSVRLAQKIEAYAVM